jgi:hypothetical protein
LCRDKRKSLYFLSGAGCHNGRKTPVLAVLPARMVVLLLLPFQKLNRRLDGHVATLLAFDEGWNKGRVRENRKP